MADETELIGDGPVIRMWNGKTVSRRGNGLGARKIVTEILPPPPPGPRHPKGKAIGSQRRFDPTDVMPIRG